MEKSENRKKVEMSILRFCNSEFKSLADFAEHLYMNKHTLRAHYLYPMVKEGLLVRSTDTPHKSTVRYKAA